MFEKIISKLRFGSCASKSSDTVKASIKKNKVNQEK